MLALFIGVIFDTISESAERIRDLVGTVTDSSGAVIPGATVSLTNLGTNEKKVMKADAAGNYRFVNLPPTQYKVEFEKTSYKHVVQSPVAVQVDSTGRLDVSLEVGAVSETVEVTSQAPLLQTESGTLGSQVEGKTVAGNAPQRPQRHQPDRAGSRRCAAGRFHGQHHHEPGHPHQQCRLGQLPDRWLHLRSGFVYARRRAAHTAFGHDVAYIPTQDAIQEFKVATNSVSAEFGRFAGGVVEMTTKSGTNNFHGSAYEYLRNTVLNANTYTGSAYQQAEVASEPVRRCRRRPGP